MEINKPRRLEYGGSIGVVTPSESIRPEKIERYRKGLSCLRDFGFNVLEGKYVLSRGGEHINAPDEERAKDINDMFVNPKVGAILFTTGGANSNGILPHINYPLISENPKIIVGLSDSTSIINSIHQRTGLVTFHGPSILSDFGKGIYPYTSSYFFKAVNSTQPIGEIAELSPREVLKEGRATGKMIGGNLFALQFLLGTPYEPDWKGKLLFLEDIWTEPHNFENKLNHLAQAGVLEKIVGLVIGRCVDCDMKSYTDKITIPDVVKKVCAPYDFPILYNVDLGHTVEKATIPLGVIGEIDCFKKSISILESAVV